MKSFRVFVLVLLVGFLETFAFQQQQQSSSATTTQLSMGLFDGFIKSMESGYAGGEDSPYAKIKQQDEAKRQAQKEAAAAKRAKGFKLLKDVKEKSFVQLKYEQEDKEDAIDKWAKNAREKGGSGFKFPWDD